MLFCNDGYSFGPNLQLRTQSQITVKIRFSSNDPTREVFFILLDTFFQLAARHQTQQYNRLELELGYQLKYFSIISSKKLLKSVLLRFEQILFKYLSLFRNLKWIFVEYNKSAEIVELEPQRWLV